MNKETRSFIWGLIMFLICGLALVIHIIEIQSGKPRDWYDFTLMVLTFIGMMSGLSRIYKSID